MVDGIALERTQVGTSSKAVGNQRAWVLTIPFETSPVGLRLSH